MNSVNSSEERKGNFGKGVKGKVPTVSPFHAGSSFKGASCSVCDKQNHNTIKYYDLLKLKGTQRITKMKCTRLCFRCLNRGHIASECVTKATCKNCCGPHNVILCDKKVECTIR